MRLTLRTLLAYLDDRLSPANAKELGQKIAKSAFTTELVERIRDVKRRRRLAMPDKPVAMIDANLVAEYLDDQLTPELVARIEKQVLASDTMLAEVASAHEILGLLRDPVSIEPRLLNRLYALDPTGNTDVVRALGNERSANPKPATVDGTEWKPLPVPGESTRRVPIFIVAGLAIVWLTTIISDSVFFKPETLSDIIVKAGGDANDEGQPGNKVKPDKVPAVGDESDSPTNQKDATPKIAPVENTSNDSDVVAAISPDETPVPEITTVPPELAVAVPDIAPAAPVPSPAATTADIPEVEIADVPAVKIEPEQSDKPENPNVPIHLMSNNKTFLVFDESVDHWMRLDQIPGGEIVSTTRNNADCRSLFQQRWFTVAEPFSADITAGERGWIATMSGTTLARLPAANAQDLEVYSGRVKLSADATQPWAEGRSSVFRLKTAAVTSMLVLQSRDAVVGMEIVPVANVLQNYGQSVVDSHSAVPLHLAGADFQIKVTVVTGQVAVRFSDIEEEYTLSKGTGLSWFAPDSADPASDKSMPENITPDDGTQIAAAPSWLHRTADPVSEAEALNTSIKEALASGDDAVPAVSPLLSDRNPQLGVRAIYVLTATRDVDRLLSALFEPFDEAVHRAAIDGLSHIANGSTAGRRAIKIALETRIPMSEVDVTVSLIQGFGDAEARDPAYCRTLIDMLSNDRLATRTLAFYRIQQYSNDRLGYQPEAESSRRRSAVRRWERLLDRNDGKLLP